MTRIGQRLSGAWCVWLLTVSVSAAAPPKVIDLFDGESLKGWSFVTNKDGVKMEDVWSAADGVLHCKGKPVGYLRTDDSFENYTLTLQWRWKPGTPGGNNGVLVHTSSPGALGVWPKSIEVQLGKGNAGDFWVIGTELTVENQETRNKPGTRRYLNLTDDSEKEAGQWNEMKIECSRDEIRVWVNGDMVNHAMKCNVTSGAICLQSEGAPIEFRKIQLRPLADKND